MGTSLALAGAYNLAGALAVHADDIPAAFVAYEEAQRPLVTPAQRLSPAIGLIFDTTTSGWVTFLNYFSASVSYFVPVAKLFVSLIAPGKGTPRLREYGFGVPEDEEEAEGI